MALQGDLSSFALADVLRLLARTAKSGALEVSSSTGTGEVWLRDGSIVGGAVTGAPHALRGADFLLELLRFEGGSFAFDDTVDITEEGGSSVDSTLHEAEDLLAEWLDVETVVPSMDAWLTLAPELTGHEVAVSADDWGAVATIGSGRSVRALAGLLELTDLAVSRQVKGLAEQGLVQVRVDEQQPVHHEEAPAGADADSEVGSNTTPESDINVAARQRASKRIAEQDLAALHTDDTSVLLSSAEGTLLPEPLPGEGSSYATDDLLGSVDGRHEEVDEDLSAWHTLSGVGTDEPSAEVRATESWASSRSEPAEESGGARPDASSEVDSSDDGDDLGADDPVSETTDDRGSLLRFLSTVKP